MSFPQQPPQRPQPPYYGPPRQGPVRPPTGGYQQQRQQPPRYYQPPPPPQQHWVQQPPQGYYGPPKPRKEPMPVFGAVLMMIGGLLGLLGGILPWVTVLGTSITGFGLGAAAEAMGGDGDLIQVTIWLVAVFGVAVLVCGGAFLAQKDNPTWGVTIAAIASGLATLIGIFDFVSFASRGALGAGGIGMWCYLLSGVVGFIGLSGAGTKKF